MKYRKKPVVIEAEQFTTNNEEGSPTMDRIVNWINRGRTQVGAWHNETDIFIITLEGTMRAVVGDWIIRGVQGEFYPCKPEIFGATYEVATGSTERDTLTHVAAMQAQRIRYMEQRLPNMASVLQLAREFIVTDAATWHEKYKGTENFDETAIVSRIDSMLYGTRPSTKRT